MGTPKKIPISIGLKEDGDLKQDCVLATLALVGETFKDFN